MASKNHPVEHVKNQSSGEILKYTHACRHVAVMSLSVSSRLLISSRPHAITSTRVSSSKPCVAARAPLAAWRSASPRQPYFLRRPRPLRPSHGLVTSRLPPLMALMSVTRHCPSAHAQRRRRARGSCRDWARATCAKCRHARATEQVSE